MKWKMCLLASIFIFSLPIYARRIISVTILNIQLKDGSNIKGEKLSETRDTLYVSNKHLGKVAISKKAIKFIGDNLNNGQMISVIPFFNEENKKVFSSKPTYRISISNLFDERFSPALDFGYHYQKFDYQTSKYLESTTMDTFGVFSGNYTYKTNFFMPSLTLRFSPLPSSTLEKLTQNHGIYPYFGLGIGYGVGFVNYELRASEIKFEAKTHHYFGIIFQGIAGVSVKISSRTAFVFETIYENATFRQRLFNKEKNFIFEQDEFRLEGLKLSIGVRFGVF
jgi:hypothetical protein